MPNFYNGFKQLENNDFDYILLNANYLGKLSNKHGRDLKDSTDNTMELISTHYKNDTKFFSGECSHSIDDPEYYTDLYSALIKIDPTINKLPAALVRINHGIEDDYRAGSFELMCLIEQAWGDNSKNKFCRYLASNSVYQNYVIELDDEKRHKMRVLVLRVDVEL